VRQRRAPEVGAQRSVGRLVQRGDEREIGSGILDCGDGAAALHSEKGNTGGESNDGDDDNEGPKASAAGMRPGSPHLAGVKKINELIQNATELDGGSSVAPDGPGNRKEMKRRARRKRRQSRTGKRSPLKS
jgi:hypothetical protein